MAIVFFEDSSSSSQGLPFVNEYVRKPGAIGTTHDILFIAPSRKGTGLVLKTDLFMVFLWKKSKACDFVLNAVRNSETDCGYPLVVVLKKADPFFDLGLDTTRTAFFVQEKDDFTERTSFLLSLQPQETFTGSPLPQTQKKNRTPQA